MVWAEAHGGVIGRGGTMPWHVPEDLAHFREVTAGATVIMGRRTWESLPERFRPLPDRHNIVVTTNPAYEAEGADTAASLDEAIDAGARSGQPVWIMGGGELYRQAMPLADALEVTTIDIAVADADTFAPTIDEDWVAVDASTWRESKTGLRFRFTSYRRRPGTDSGTLKE